MAAPQFTLPDPTLNNDQNNDNNNNVNMLNTNNNVNNPNMNTQIDPIQNPTNNDNFTPNNYANITNSMNALLGPIQEDIEQTLQKPQQQQPRPSFQTITTLPQFIKRKSIDDGEYKAPNVFTIKKKSSKKLKPKNKNDSDSDSDNDYASYGAFGADPAADDNNNINDIFFNPPSNIDDKTNNEFADKIKSEYDGLGLNNFIDLMVDNSRECDKLYNLMCDKNVSKSALKSNDYSLTDLLNMRDPSDNGGLNVKDYDIDMNELEELFYSTNNNILSQFMSCYYKKQLPFEPKQPYPMGIIETNRQKEIKKKLKVNKNYVIDYKRDKKQKIKERKKKKKQRQRRKRRKLRRKKRKIVKKKMELLQAKLANQLPPNFQNALFNPKSLLPQLRASNDDDDYKNTEIEEQLKQVNTNVDLATDASALGHIHNNNAKSNIANIRFSRQATLKNNLKHAQRHSEIMKLSPMFGGMNNQKVKSPYFDDNHNFTFKVEDVYNPHFDDKPFTMSSDYIGKIKRYSRGIKNGQSEFVDRYVLYKAAYQYYVGLYIKYCDIVSVVRNEMHLNQIDYDQIKYQMESQEPIQDARRQTLSNVSINIGGLSADLIFHTSTDATSKFRLAIQCPLDLVHYVELKRRRDCDVLIQNCRLYKQIASIQLESMGVDLNDINIDNYTENLNHNQIVEYFSSKAIAEEKDIVNHDEDDDNTRMCAIIYDDYNDIELNRSWKTKKKMQQRILDTYLIRKKTQNPENPSLWKKIDSKYCQEFVHKFCGFYSYESRPVLFKTIWFARSWDVESGDMWPANVLKHVGDIFMEKINKKKNKPFIIGTGAQVNNNVGCQSQITGALHKNNILSDGELLQGNPSMAAFYHRVLNNIPPLRDNLSDLLLPQFIWNLNKSEVEKYGTYLLCNWKQSGSGFINSNSDQDIFKMNCGTSVMNEMRFYADQKWYIYRLRYWKEFAKDNKRGDNAFLLSLAGGVSDSDSDSDDERPEMVSGDRLWESVEWWGSNDPSLRDSSLRLVEDRFCIQNDHCFGKPTLFFWSHDYSNNSDNKTDDNDPIKIRNYGVSSNIISDPTQCPSIFDTNCPIIKSGLPPDSGPIRNGTFHIGGQDLEGEYDCMDVFKGIVSMDCYTPPIFNLCVYDDIDTLNYNWNRVNHDNICDKSTSKRMSFTNINLSFNKLINDDNNILKSWSDELLKWIDYNNYPVYDKYNNKYPSILSNAFYFSNFLFRTYHYGNKNIAKIIYPRNWQNCCSINNNKSGVINDEWTLSFGFTHPRPCAPEKVAVLLYKKDCIEVRIVCDTAQMNGAEIMDNLHGKFIADLVPADMDDKYGKTFTPMTSGAKYKWTEERLEIILYNNDKKIVLFSKIIRDKFKWKDCFYSFDNSKFDKNNKKFVFCENNFNSHVVILSKNVDNNVKCYLDGNCVYNQTINDLKTNMLSNNNANKATNVNEILIAHKPTNNNKNVHSLFHGYLYSIALHPKSFKMHELNQLHRQLVVYRKLHIQSLWFRNKKELSQQLYKQIF